MTSEFVFPVYVNFRLKEFSEWTKWIFVK